MLSPIWNKCLEHSVQLPRKRVHCAVPCNICIAVISWLYCIPKEGTTVQGHSAPCLSQPSSGCTLTLRTEQAYRDIWTLFDPTQGLVPLGRPSPGWRNKRRGTLWTMFDRTQGLVPLGTAISWLYAVPREGGLNGFSLTGGLFNYTAEVISLSLLNNLLCRFQFIFTSNCLSLYPSSTSYYYYLQDVRFFFWIFLWRARVCRPLLRLCRPFMIFEGQGVKW